MILSHYPTGLSVELEEGKATVITVESPEIMAEYVCDLKNLVENDIGEFCLYEDDSEIKFSKYVEVIIDPWSLDFNSRKVKTKLIQLINDVAIDQVQEKFFSVRSNIFSLVEELSDHIPYSLTYDTEIDMTALSKMINVRIEEGDNTTAERIVEYIKLLSSLCFVKVFFLINLRSFISDEDMTLIYREAEYVKVTLVLIESAYRGKGELEQGLIIDKDQCIIRL